MDIWGIEHIEEKRGCDQHQKSRMRAEEKRRKENRKTLRPGSHVRHSDRYIPAQRFQPWHVVKAPRLRALPRDRITLGATATESRCRRLILLHHHYCSSGIRLGTSFIALRPQQLPPASTGTASRPAPRPAPSPVPGTPAAMAAGQQRTARTPHGEGVLADGQSRPRTEEGCPCCTPSTTVLAFVDGKKDSPNLDWDGRLIKRRVDVVHGIGLNGFVVSQLTSTMTDNRRVEPALAMCAWSMNAGICDER